MTTLCNFLTKEASQQIFGRPSLRVYGSRTSKRSSETALHSLEARGAFMRRRVSGIHQDTNTRGVVLVSLLVSSSTCFSQELHSSYIWLLQSIGVYWSLEILQGGWDRQRPFEQELSVSQELHQPGWWAADSFPVALLQGMTCLTKRLR